MRSGRDKLEASGLANVALTISYDGNRQDRVRSGLALSSPKERSDWVHEELDVGSGTLRSHQIYGLESNLDSLAIEAEFASNRVGKRTGKRMFVRPSFLNTWTATLPDVEERRQPIVFPFAYSDVDTLEIEGPPGYGIEVLPEPVTIEYPFAGYSSSVTVDDAGVLRYGRRVEIREAEIGAEYYDEVRQFFQEVSRAERGQVVFVRR